MRKNSGILWLVVVLTVLAMGQWDGAWSATTGKVEGVVRDAQTGELLPGVNVVIDGTRRGATTDANGLYVILLVDPGTYSMTASMVGYNAQRQTGVVVQSDFTTTLNFTIREAALELGEITVVAERPAVEPDRTTSLYVTSAKDIEAVPIVRSAADLIELQAGVQINEAGGDIVIRGGETRDVAYYVDGVRISSTDSRGTRVYRDINRTAIQEMTVVTGGMNAEYGNAQGGVVSFVTRTGGSSYSGMVDYQFTPSGQKHWGTNVYEAPLHRGNVKWDDAEWVAEQITLPDGSSVQAHKQLPYTEKMGHFLEGNVSGPLMRDMTFFASSRWRRQASTFPSPNLETPFNTNNSLRISYAASPSIKLSVSSLYDRRKGLNGGPAEGGQLNLNDSGKNIFLSNPAPSGRNVVTDALLAASITHSLSPKTFYEVRLSYSTTSRDTQDVVLNPGIAHISEALSGNIVKDRAGYFTVYRHVVNFERYEYRRLILKGDLSSQVNRQNFVKTGFELIRFNNWYQLYYSNGPSHRQVSWFSNTYEQTDFLPGQSNAGVNPVQVGLYIQDKIEFEGMIVNVGLRGDAFFQREYVTDVDGFYGAKSPMWYESMARNVNAPTIVGPTIKGVSPRVGVSHPITANSLIRFFYGRFIQFPDFQMLYNNEFQSAAAQDKDLNRNGAIDPAERWNAFDSNTRHHTSALPPEETTSFEVGLDWNFVSNYVMGLTTYYKSAGNQVGANASQQWIDPAAPGYVNVGMGFSPGIWRDVRGFELSLRKGFSQMFSFSLAYNQQWADEGRNSAHRRDVWPDSLFVANGHYWVNWDVDPATGREIPVSLVEKARRENRADNYYIILYGGNAQAAIRTQQAAHDIRSQWAWIPWLSHYSAAGTEIRPGEVQTKYYSDADKEFWARINSNPNYPGFGEGTLMVGHSQETAERVPRSVDRRGFGSVNFLFATPADFGPANGKVLGNVRANMVYRIYTGTRFTYTSLAAGVQSYEYGPMTTRTDMNFEKQFALRGTSNLTLAVEVYNFFNEKDVRQVSPGGGRAVDFNAERWQKWGISGLEPTDAGLLQFGEINDINNYWDAPRAMNFSLRYRW